MSKRQFSSATAVWTLPIALLALNACSANSDSGSSSGSGASGGSSASGGAAPGNGAQPGSSGAPPLSGTGGSVQLGDSDRGGAGGTAGTTAGPACATQRADAPLVRAPVDIIVVIDNSGSMQDEIDAVETNINKNFASVLSASGVDYRVILLSRHEDSPERDTSICVAAPLSGNPTCSPQPEAPVFSDHFFQYSTKVESTDSLSLLISTFRGEPPDKYKLAPMGWAPWLRPSTKKIFLELTDDNSQTMTSAAFDAALLALPGDHFGTAANRNYTFHSIVGIAEKPVVSAPWLPAEAIVAEKCTGNGRKVENSGTVYQELSKLTGGLRFPLCQSQAYDAVFETIANNVVSHAAVACEFAIPDPPQGNDLDLANVAVSYTSGDGSPAKTLGQAKTQTECSDNAFYIDAASKQIKLCPAACASVQAGLKPGIEVLFTCSPTFIDPA